MCCVAGAPRLHSTASQSDSHRRPSGSHVSGRTPHRPPVPLINGPQPQTVTGQDLQSQVPSAPGMARPVPTWPVTSLQGRLVSSHPVVLTSNQAPQCHPYSTAVPTSIPGKPSPQQSWAWPKEPALREPLSCKANSVRDSYPSSGVPSILPKFMATLPHTAVPPSQPPSVVEPGRSSFVNRSGFAGLCTGPSSQPLSLIEAGRSPFAIRPGFAGLNTGVQAGSPGMVGLLDSRAGAAPSTHPCQASMPSVQTPANPCHHSLPSMQHAMFGLPAGLHGIPGAGAAPTALLHQPGAAYASSHPASFASAAQIASGAVYGSPLNMVSPAAMSLLCSVCLRPCHQYCHEN